MSQETPETPKASGKPAGPAPKGSRKDKWIKIGFAVAFAVAIVAIYLHQLRGPSMPEGWEEDVPYAMDVAREQRRPVVIFFHAEKPSDDARHIIRRALDNPQTRKAIADFNYIAVRAVTRDLDEQMPLRYGLKALPALVVLDDNGILVVKEEGKRIGHDRLTQMLEEGAKQGL
jgi:hypothetical protein